MNKKFHKYFDTINTIYFPQKIMAKNLEIIFLTRGGVAKVYIVLRGGLANVYKYLQGGRGGSKSPKSRLRRKWMPPIYKFLDMTSGGKIKLL